MNQRVLLCVLASTLFACGDDGKNPIIPDSKRVDAQVCEAANESMLDYAGFRPASTTGGAAIFWTGQLGTLDGGPLYYDLEFWDGIDPLNGTLDLASGNQTAYDTCAVCVLAYTLDADGNFARAFFQSAGSITLAADPIQTKNLSASITGLKLVEISLSDATPISGGACYNVTDASLMHDAVPNAWMGTGCERGKYNSGGACTCQCGVIDPDCTDTATLENCGNVANTDACFRAMCVTAPKNDTCENAITEVGATITIGPTGVTGTTAGAKHNYDKNLDEAKCTNVMADGYSQPGPDVAYRVALTQGVPYTVALSGLATNMDMSIALVGPAASATDASVCQTGTTNPITACVAGADAAFNGGAESFTYTPAATGTYFIIVDSWSYNVGGPFTLKVTQ